MKTLTQKGWGLLPLLLLGSVLFAPVLILPTDEVWRVARVGAGVVTTFSLLALLMTRASYSTQGFRRFLATGPNLAVALLLAWATLSFVFSAPTAGREQKIAFFELMRLAFGAALYFTTLYTFRSHRPMRLASFLLPAAGLLAAGTGILGCSPSTIQAATGAFGNKQLFAAFLGVLLPVCVVFAWRGALPWIRRFAAVSTVLVSIALILSANRTSWIAGAAGLLVVFVLARRIAAYRSQKRTTFGRRWLVAAFAAIIATGLLFALPGTRLQMRDRLSPAAASATLGARLRLWSACGRMIRERPLTGGGIGSFAWKAGDYTREAPSAKQVEWQGYSLSSMAHNEYLQFGAELGLVGLGLYLAVLAGFFYRGVRSLRSVPTGTRRWLLLACLGAVTAQCMDALGNPAWRFIDISPLLWLLLGLGTAVTSPPWPARSTRKAPVSTPRTAAYRRRQRLAIAMVLIFLAGGWEYGTANAGTPAGTSTPDGNLATANRDFITGQELATWIAAAMPECKYRLVILTECYGGNIVQDFAGDTSTLVLSGTSPGEQSFTEGFDTHAAAALLPATGNTANNVYVAGVAERATDVTVEVVGDDGKESPATVSETPSMGGALSSFSLDPTSPDAANPATAKTPLPYGRHIVVYGGMIGTVTVNGHMMLDEVAQNDAQMRDMIRQRFSGGFNTTITTIGGTDGAGGAGAGWDMPATRQVMRGVLNSIGTLIKNSSVPDHEQFILFVADHGGLRTQTLVPIHANIAPQSRLRLNNARLLLNKVTAQGSAISLSSAATTVPFQTFLSSDLDPAGLTIDPLNTPGFSAFIDFYQAGMTVTANPFNPGDWNMILHHPTAGDFALDSFIAQPRDLDGDGIIGDSPGEGFSLFFPMQTSTFVSNFFDVAISIEIQNNTTITWPVSKVAQETGPISSLVSPDITPNLTLLRGGLRLNHGTGQFVQQVTIQNTSGLSFTGPLYLALDNLSGNAALSNKNGVTANLAPLGSPYVTVSPGTMGVLNPGQSIMVTLQFFNPTNQGISYSTRILSGVSAP